MANPDPEITPPEVAAVRKDAIVATGRSDYPNQVNNVLGFPFIFRGALDVRARKINEEMKQAAVRALAELATPRRGRGYSRRRGATPTPARSSTSVRVHHPEALRPRVLLHVAPAVAEAAVASGVSRLPLDIAELSPLPREAVSWKFRASSRRASVLRRSEETWRSRRS